MLRLEIVAIAIFQKNPRAHKNKIGTSPPTPKNLKYPPPPKTRNFMDMGFFLQKERIFPGVHKIGAAISGPRTADKKFYGHEDFSEFCGLENPAKERLFSWLVPQKKGFFSWLVPPLPWKTKKNTRCIQLARYFGKIGDLKITSTSTERQKPSQNLAPVLVIISWNSLVFSRRIITSAGFLPVLRPRRVSTSSGNKSVSHKRSLRSPS